MKAKREQVDDKLMVIKLFASNYARDLVNTFLNYTNTNVNQIIKKHNKADNSILINDVQNLFKM